MIRANLHNFAFVVGFALLGFLMLRMSARTRAAKWPVVGQVLQLTGLSVAKAA